MAPTPAQDFASTWNLAANEQDRPVPVTHSTAGPSSYKKSRVPKMAPSAEKFPYSADQFVKTKLEAARSILSQLGLNKNKTGGSNEKLESQYTADGFKKPYHAHMKVPVTYKLNHKTLSECPKSVVAPSYDPSKVTPSILHIGTGNFALAHLGSYIHDLLPLDNSWGIVAVSLRSQKTLNALRKQDNMYLLVERKDQQRVTKVMAPVVDTIFAPRDPQILVRRIADPSIRCITVTITNKGYYLAAAGTKLDLNHADIKHDLMNPDQPKTVYGYLAAGLHFRRQNGAGPLSVLSLDNIEQNSKTFHMGFLQFLDKVNPNLIPYVESQTAFLTTLVDRITPEPTDSFRTESHQQIGFSSTLTIGCESYRQLIIDAPPAHIPLPPLDKVGVKIVPNSGDYWQRKFYCLNAAHMVLATAGARMGAKYIHDTIRVPQLHRLIHRAQKEWCTFLATSPAEQAELAQYTAQIRERFSDPALNDTVRRVGARATSKLSDRLLSAIDRAPQPSVMRVPTFTLAMYLHNLSRKTQRGNAFEADDAEYAAISPIYEFLQQTLAALPETATAVSRDAVRHILQFLAQKLGDPRFSRLANVPSFIGALGRSLYLLHKHTVEEAISQLLDDEADSDLEFVGGKGKNVKRMSSVDVHSKRDMMMIKRGRAESTKISFSAATAGMEATA